MTYIPAINVRWLVIHYSATSIEEPTSYEQIAIRHKLRGFKDFGYHAYSTRDGKRTNGRDVLESGRFEQGAHSKGENDASLGYCYEGGVKLYDVETGFDTRTPEQTADMISWIDEMLAKYGGDGIDPKKGPVVIGHRDMPGAATQCPGFDAGAWWASVVAERKKAKPARDMRNLIAFFAALFGGKR